MIPHLKVTLLERRLPYVGREDSALQLLLRTALAVAMLLAITACERQTRSQSEHDALARLCEVPARVAREPADIDDWVATNVRHASVAWLYAHYKTRVFSGTVRLHEAARKSGIEHCELLEPDWATVRLADLSGRTPIAPDALPFIVVGRTHIGVAGRPIVETQKVRGDAPFINGVRDAVKVARGGVDRAVVNVDANTSYRLLTKVLWSAAAGGVWRFSLQARKGDKIASLLLELPKRAPATSSPPPFVVVSAAGNELKVWSMDAKDGTATAPSYTAKRGHRLNQLAAALERIVLRRYNNQPRSNEERGIILNLSPDASAQEVLDLMSHLQLSPSGVELFPNVMFAPIEE